MLLRESRRASADLDAIFEYGMLNFGVAAAISYVEKLDGIYRRLTEHPQSGRPEPELGPGTRSISYEAHRIYYEIDGDTVVVLAILHKSVDVSRWLE
jgi:toxin ParE1/3/4